MEKKTFIQQIVIHYRCKPDDIDRAISYGEQVWDMLSARGYGAAQKGVERRTKDYYAKLLPDQRDKFDKFWKVFRKKEGKQRAAKSWLAISPDDALYQDILRGAEHEARARQDRKTTAPWAELWLNERRWEDSPVQKQVEPTEHKIDAGQLRHCLSMVKLFEDQGNAKMADYWREQAENAQKL